MNRDASVAVEQFFDVIVIGAGAAGLFCAAECGKRGRAVLVLDHSPRTASKVRISGGGRCNFTNLNVDADHYHSENPDFVRSALARFTPRHMLDLVQQHNIAWYEKEAGQIFCKKSSREIVDLLERECGRAGVTVLLDNRITSIKKVDGFAVTANGRAFGCSSLVIATGGLSYPHLGASSFGHTVARQFGIAVVPPRPALVPFLLPARDRKRFRDCAGISIDALVRCGGRGSRGNILVTHRGLSGPAALQASLSWQPHAAVDVDLLPGMNVLEVLMKKRQSKMILQNFLSGLLPRRFVHAWCDPAIAEKQITQCSNRELRDLAERLHRWHIVPSGTEGYGTAEVTAGGVDTDGLSSKTLETIKVPGLYFIGEVVDVTGELGGYNLHWAWASAHAAGQSA